MFAALETAFEVLVESGYAPETALMELHGSGELGQVLTAAGNEGLYEMIRSHASPACQAGIAHHWDRALGDRAMVRSRIRETIDAIRDGTFARHLLDQQGRRYPELDAWRQHRPAALVAAERSVQEFLNKPPQR